jgi:hypothetical protein
MNRNIGELNRGWLTFSVVLAVVVGFGLYVSIPFGEASADDGTIEQLTLVVDGLEGDLAALDRRLAAIEKTIAEFAVRDVRPQEIQALQRQLKEVRSLQESLEKSVTDRLGNVERRLSALEHAHKQD